MSTDERLEFLLRSTESRHAQVHELFGIAQEHTKQLTQDAENIRALGRIAAIREGRLTNLENGKAE